MEHNLAEHTEQPLQLISSLHLQEEADGEGVVVDDRTFTSAHINKAAFILLEALRQPRSREELTTLLAEAASFDADTASMHVNQLVDELLGLGWIEPANGVTV